MTTFKPVYANFQCISFHSFVKKSGKKCTYNFARACFSTCLSIWNNKNDERIVIKLITILKFINRFQFGLESDKNKDDLHALLQEFRWIFIGVKIVSRKQSRKLWNRSYAQETLTLSTGLMVFELNEPFMLFVYFLTCLYPLNFGPNYHGTETANWIS
jgi:hypothetical protein